MKQAIFGTTVLWQGDSGISDILASESRSISQINDSLNTNLATPLTRVLHHVENQCKRLVLELITITSSERCLDMINRSVYR